MEIQKHRTSKIPGLRKEIEIAGQRVSMNDVLEAKTVKGNTNYIIFFFELNESVYCMHGDRAKKYPRQQFYDAFEYGDLWKVTPDNVDPERLRLAAMNLQAMMDGLAFGDYMKIRHGAGEFSKT